MKLVSFVNDIVEQSIVLMPAILIIAFWDICLFDRSFSSGAICPSAGWLLQVPIWNSGWPTKTVWTVIMGPKLVGRSGDLLLVTVGLMINDSWRSAP